MATAAEFPPLEDIPEAGTAPETDAPKDKRSAPWSKERREAHAKAQRDRREREGTSRSKRDKGPRGSMTKAKVRSTLKDGVGLLAMAVTMKDRPTATDSGELIVGPWGMTGQILDARSDKLADAWAEVAMDSPAMLRMLQATSVGGKWGMAILATAGTVIPILVVHGKVPPQLGIALAFAENAGQPNDG